MLEQWNRFCFAVLDPLLSWALQLPRDLVLLFVALASAAILTWVRRYTTDQDLLRRVAADKSRLKERLRAAKGSNLPVTARRVRTTQAEVAMKALRQEGMPLLVSLIPIAMLATWCFARMDYRPIREGASVEVVIHTPASAVGEHVHILPTAGIKDPEGSWIREIQEDRSSDGRVENGVAHWRLRGVTGVHLLTFRLRGNSHEHELRIGGWQYSPPIVDHGANVVSELRMQRVRPFGVVPGLDALGLPPWMIGYALVVIPSVFLIRRLCSIY